MTTQTPARHGGRGPDALARRPHRRRRRAAIRSTRTLAFKAFNPAFVGLLGRGAQLTTDEMQAFTDFILTVTLPAQPDPLPRRRGDDGAEHAGRTCSSPATPIGGAITCDVLPPPAVRHRRPLDLRGRDAGVQDRPPAQPLPEGRHVRRRRRRDRGRPGARLRLPARRQRLDRVQLHLVVGLPEPEHHRQAATSSSSCSPSTPGSSPSVGQQVSIDATTFNDDGVRRTASTCWSRRPTPATATWS